MITAKRKELLIAELNSRAHKFVSGLSEKLGGHDEGPDPHEFLEASLAACTILTAQLYANRKGMKLESTDVTIKILEETKESTKILREVSYRGDLTPDDRDKLTVIINKCPIHNLLQSKITIETVLI